jgi:hypothetical protein
MSVPQPLTLTFAELEFVLLACPQQAATLRSRLRLSPADTKAFDTDGGADASESDTGDVSADETAAAGLASLLVRGLCEASSAQGESDVVPGPEITALAAAFASARSYTTAAGWRGQQTDVMHLFDASSVRVALFPFQYGIYDVRFLDPAEPLSGPLGRYLDAHVAPGEVCVFVAEATAGPTSVAATATVDASGAWFASDTLFRPDAVASASREAFHARLIDLFDRALQTAHENTATNNTATASGAAAH